MVIAIIGILSAVVLASLGTARSRAQDAKIMAEMKSFQTAAEIFYATHGKYRRTENTTPGIFSSTGINPLTESNVDGCSGNVPNCSGFTGAVFGDVSSGAKAIITSLLQAGVRAKYNNISYALIAKTSKKTWYCVDSSGNARDTLEPVTTASNEGSANAVLTDGVSGSSGDKDSIITCK